MNSNNILNLLDPENLFKVLQTKVDKSRVDDNYSTTALKVSDLQESEINEKRERKLASTKALLILSILINKNKIDFGHLSPNYKGDRINIFNKYLKDSSLDDSLIPFNVKGARELYNDLIETIATLGEIVNEDLSYKVHYDDLVHFFNYYDESGAYAPIVGKDKKTVFSKEASMKMFQYLWENTLVLSAKSDEYSGDITNRLLSQIDDPLRKLKIDKIATTFALKSAFQSLTDTILAKELALSTRINGVNSYLDRVHRLVKNFTAISITKGTSLLVIPHSELIEGVYNVSISLEDSASSIDTYQVFKVLIPTTIDSTRAKIILDDKISRYKNNDDINSSFELKYDDAPDKGLVLTLLGNYSKTAGKIMKVRMTREA